MKKIFLTMLCAATTALQAQDIYSIESFSQRDLSGTARYVSMGGAMGALGADLSTMGSNPAGIGLYRRNDIATTLSLTAQPHAEKMQGIGRTRVSYDQLGFVVATHVDMDALQFINFGINYHKSRNFKNHINIGNCPTYDMSQSWQMMDLAYSGGWLNLDDDRDRELTTPFTNLGYDTYLINPTVDKDGNIDGYEPSNADSYNYKRVQWGGIHQWDFNIAMNFNDRFYAGLTASYYDLNQRSYTDYTERLINPADNSLHDYYFINDEQIEGEGYGAILGVVWRPIEESPFRVGLALHTPVHYVIDTYTDIYMDTPYASNGQNYTARGMGVNNNYEVDTPWRFNLSAGGTLVNSFAYGVEYEYTDASAAKVTYDEGFVEDHAIKREAERYLKGQHNFRLGAELKVTNSFAIRAGYNYLSSPFEKKAFLNHFLDSSNYYYATRTDYANLSETHRMTAGLGYTYKGFYCDLAYQYQTQHADVYAFHLPESGSNNINRLQASRVDLNRHNMHFTIGYKF